MGGTINSLDATAPGSTREVFGISMNVYDRLASFGRKQVDDYWTFDFDNIRGELAERVERSADGRTLTFHLRQGAKWHDGSPVTAADVKWSLDRAVISKTLSPAQLASGSLTKADQFRIASDNVVEVMLDKPDRLALANLCVPFSPMINSTLAKKNATEEDPWAVNWLKENAAAGGAYTVEQHRAGQQTILRRNEAWQNGAGGKLPFFQRVIAQTVPEAATRANLVERGDADLAIDLQASDISALEQRKKVKVLAIPQTNGFTALVFNVRQAPFNNAKVRAAIAAAIPYENLFKAALFERGRVLYGASWTEAPNGDFPQPLPERFDLDKAKSLLAEAGMASGFATTFSYPAGAAAFGEPMAALIKESLGRIGIDVSIQKMPDAQYTTMEVERRLAISLGTGTAWLPAPDYFMRTYFAFEQRWNFSGMRDPELEALVQDARFETDAAKYQATSRKMIDIVAREMPMVMLWQPNQDAVMMPQVQGFTYAFHRQADYRDLSRA
ncbi:putative D,D-dipeptide-binding periplasmic protein DdpA precursor [Variibacter gotjawalensis]|uniref:Putative D,D-dipeptide-binding periplasmic protein DdpA n=2 Tax=Variibacter gotjawalensis TaxID=1333996 RepID=A0A0S3PZW5_9BRAD|nr:putative D,D-dipeptide-binding periplasmic protein DdpA precursor [Variibacter gotjawalensis]